MAASSGTYSAEYLAESKTSLIKAFYSLPIPLEIFSTLLRIWVKVRPSSTSRLAFDDYLMIWATISSVTLCVLGLIYGPPYGLGRHRAALTDADLKMLLIGDYIFSHFYDMAIACTKLSVLTLYYRIFSTHNIRIVVICTSVFVVMWLIVMEVVLGLGCRPIQAWWGDAPGAFTCVNKVHFTYFTNITNIVTDIWIFSLPIPIILSLQLTRDRRLSLLFLFSVGLGTVAISAGRLKFIIGVGSEDFTWTMADLGILSVWEPCGGILCANLPLVYRAVLQMVLSVRDTVQGTRPKASDTAGSQRPSQAALSHDWRRLDYSEDGTTSREDIPRDTATPKSSTAIHQYEMHSVSGPKKGY